MIMQARQAESAGHLDAVLDLVQLGLMVLDGDGRISFFNRWMVERSAIAASEAIGHSLTELFPEISGKRIDMALRACLEKGLPSLLSNSLHPSPLPLYADGQKRAEGERVQQSIRIQSLPGNATAKVLIEVSDVSSAVRRERVLTQQANQLKSLSMLDPLTGLANRRQMDEVLDREYRRACRSGQPLSIVLMDIDAFKQYNDSYGHQAGDQCLIAVAKCLQANLKRSSDFVARYGGEEFLLILPETNLDGAMVIAGQMRRSVEALQIVHGGSSHNGVITISQGVASYPSKSGTTINDLVAKADIALYAAKRAGRNRVAGLPGGAQLDPEAAQISSTNV